MSDVCCTIHDIFNTKEPHGFPFSEEEIPRNGIYILFEQGEPAHGGHRIVRIGTHTGGDQLRSRLKQHFMTKNKDRSIFRKNIGRCFLHRASDPFLQDWNFDLTSREKRERHGNRIDFDKQADVEDRVSDYIQETFFFSISAVPTKEDRLALESKLISTVSLCDECNPSEDWLGLASPRRKIRESGLWQVQHLYKEPFTSKELEDRKQHLL